MYLILIFQYNLYLHIYLNRYWKIYTLDLTSSFCQSIFYTLDNTPSLFSPVFQHICNLNYVPKKGKTKNKEIKVLLDYEHSSARPMVIVMTIIVG